MLNQNEDLGALDILSLISFAMNVQNLQKNTTQNIMQQRILDDLEQVKSVLNKHGAQLDEILGLLKRGDTV